MPPKLSTSKNPEIQQKNGFIHSIRQHGVAQPLFITKLHRLVPYMYKGLIIEVVPPVPHWGAAATLTKNEIGAKKIMATALQETAARLVGGKFTGNASRDIDKRIQATRDALQLSINAKLDKAEFDQFLAGFESPAPGGGSVDIQPNGDGTANIGNLLVPIIDPETGLLTGAGLQSVPIGARGGSTYDVCDPEFGADPTGKNDSTAAIQKAQDKAYADGGGTVYLRAGRYRVSFPFIEAGGRVTFMGDGLGSTYILADTSKTSSFPETGVFHTGSYAEPKTKRDTYRVGIHNLTILKTSETTGEPFVGADGEFQHAAVEHMNPNIWGVCFHTYLGEGPADPDAVHQVSNVEIWDMAGGIAYLGLDDQGIQTYNVRIRRALKQTALIGKPYDHPKAYDVNPKDGTKPYRRTGAADNKFVGLDASGGNLSQKGYAGVEIYTSQCKFFSSTSWYNKRYIAGNEKRADGVTPVSGDDVSIYNLKATTTETKVPGAVNDKVDDFRFAKDGAGWYVVGLRNMFIGCTAQENGGHGFVVVGAMTQISACIGESSGYFDTSNGLAKPGESANFLFTNWSWSTGAHNMRAHNAYKREQAAKYGFYFQDYVNNIRAEMSFSYNMPFKVGTAGETWDVRVPGSPGENLKIEVNSFYLSTLARDQPKTPAAEMMIPTEIPGLLAAWDFSEKSAITAANGRVSAVTATGKEQQANFTLKQADPAKQPWVSSMGGRQAIKTHSAGPEFLQSIDGIGTIPAATGYTIAVVAAINSKVNGQYLWSGAGGGSANATSIYITELLGVRVNSNGGSKGTTVKSADKALTQWAPAVIVMTATTGTKDSDGATIPAGVTAYVNGDKYTEIVNTPGSINDFDGTKYATIGAYYGGTGAADAAIGEAAIFSGVLSEKKIASLTEYLKAKWF